MTHSCGFLSKNLGLFCKYSLIYRALFAKETYVFREPTHHSHLIVQDSSHCSHSMWEGGILIHLLMCVPWHTQKCAMIRSYVSLSTNALVALHGNRCNSQWLNHMCAMTHSYVCHDPLMCAITPPYLCHDTILCASMYLSTTHNPREPLQFSITHSYVCHDSFIFVPWLIHMCLYLLIHQSQSPNPETQFLGTNSNRTKISFWISTMRYRGIWVTRFGRFRGCCIFRGNCHHARKAAWNPAGVEPIYWKPADINPGSLKWVQLGNAL